MGRNHGDRYFEPLWTEIERLAIPLATHDGYGSLLPTFGEDRYQLTAERRAVCHAFEGMAVLMSLIFGGVFERHPRLQVAVLEAGAGWIPFWCERLDSHAETFCFELRHLSARPTEYVKRCCYASVDPDERSARHAIDFLGGATRLLFSCDYPHVDGKWPVAVRELLANDALSADEKRMILWDNPARLYGIGTAQ
jgi:predicted TIM-barrel fold metal-dependent hydrolase